MISKKLDFTNERYKLYHTLIVFGAVFLLAGSLWFAYRCAPERTGVFSSKYEACLVIDPGHGGIDGGAIAYNGQRESELNLSIALKLRDLASFYGLDTCMTREDENPRSGYENYSEREELAYRADLAKNTEHAVLISIHQNFFPTSQPSGAQVLYASDTESRRLGELTHENLVHSLQPENRRVAVPASPGLYLTSHVTCPAILVECGFMSNLNDLLLLSDEQYQRSFAAVLLCSYLQFARAPST